MLAAIFLAKPSMLNNLTTRSTPHSIPPRARKHPRRLELHGQTRVDPYYWLRDRKNPNVIQYLEAENAYTTAAMQPTVALQEELYQEMRSRIQERDQSAPVRRGDYFYYSRTEEGQQYEIHCRRHQSMDTPEELLLDENVLATGHSYFMLDNFRVSPDQHLLAYAVDTDGSESYTLYIKDLSTGALLAERIPNTYYGLEWANDSQRLLYVTFDHAHRPYRVYCHRLGSDPTTDVLLYEEREEKYYLELDKTRSQAYFLVKLDSSLTSEVRFLSADDPQDTLQVVEPRTQGMEYAVEHQRGQQGDRFFITTNADATNFRIVTTPVATPGRNHWQPFLPQRDDVTVNDCDAFANHLVVYERANGLRQLRVIALATGEQHCIEFPDAVYGVFRAENPEYASDQVRFNYSSLALPETLYAYNMAEHSRQLVKQKPVPGYNPQHYQTERLWATALDGKQVPLSVVYRKGTPLNGSAPALLRSYGAYGHSQEPVFNSNVISLLDRGFVFALAHIRGGGELGRGWQDDGKLLQKKNTFTDFIAAAEHLVAQGYTSPQRLIIYGRSAGGLLMGAVTNMRPDLFAGVIAGVPFVDVISTMADPTIPLTVNEWEEWGNPCDQTAYNYIITYSPYDNVTAKPYPNLLVTAALNDPRVPYWEPAKWVAKLRTTKTNDNRLLLKTNMAAGHSGASGRFDYLHECAFEYAFMLAVVD